MSQTPDPILSSFANTVCVPAHHHTSAFAKQDHWLLSAIVTASDDAILSKTLDGIITSWNPAAERMFGYTAQEIIGQPKTILFPPDCLQEEQIILERLQRGTATDHFETVRVRKDGTPVHVSVTISPIKDEDGQVIGASTIARDITVQKQMELALRKSQEKLMLAQQVAQIGSWEYDLATGKMSWSPEMFRLLGLASQQAEPDYQAQLTLFHPDDTNRLDACVQRAITQGIEYEIDLRRAVALGQPPWYHAVGAPVKDASGQVIRLVGTLQNITERKVAERQLAWANSQLENQMLLVKEQAVELKAQQAELLQMNDALEERVNVRTIELIRANADLQEVGERLHVTWGRLEEAQRVAHVGSWDFDVASGQVTWSKEQFRLFDIDPALGPPSYEQFIQCFHPEDIACYHAVVQKILEDGLPYEIDIRILKKDGSLRWTHTSGQADKDAQGKVVRLFGTNLDVTEQVVVEQHRKLTHSQLESQMRLVNEQTMILEAQQGALQATNGELAKKTDEIARSNADLQQFAYVASHDLQEPLRMVASYLELLEMEYQERLDDEAREYIAFAVDGALRMKTLINDLLAYSRVGTQINQFQTVTLSGLYANAVANLQLAITESGAEITCDALPMVMGDEAQLLSLFQNLIGNALKYRGGAAPRIHLSAERRENEWVFSVADNGIGIAPKHFERIFVIFQRLHGKGKYPGTGIGLALCKKIVELHGGRLWVCSEPGSGSTFSFTMPVAAEATSSLLAA